MTCDQYILNNIDKVSFANETIIETPKINFENYVTKNNVLVDLNKIIGSDHSDYYNKTWLEALKNLKRPDRLYKLNCDGEKPNLSYYTANNKLNYTTNNWTIYIINNEFGYISEGNHRTIIAKFLAALGSIPNEIIIPKVVYITCKNDNFHENKRKQNKLLKFFDWVKSIKI
ncbi:MAG: hypothetical protein WC253_07285 [Sulfurovaceae bacterium]